MSDYTAINTESGKRTLVVMKKIVENALNYSNSENKYKIKENSKWLQEENYFVKEYEIIGDNIEKYNIKIKGNIAENFEISDIKNNKFFIKVPILEMSESVDFIIEAEVEAKLNPVLYGKSEIDTQQDYAVSGIIFDFENIEYQDSYEKNITNLKIVKKDKDSGERLKNVKFEISDEKGDIVYRDLYTNSNGEIIIENMIPGKYYIREIESLDGYEIYKELIEIDIKYNEENFIEIENIKKEISENTDIPKLPKTGY